MKIGASNSKQQNKLLLIIFIILGLIIIGLIVGIIIIKLSSADVDTEPDTPTETTIPSKHSSDFEEINRKAENMSLDEAKQLYEQIINKAESEIEKSEAKIEYGRFLLLFNQPELAIEQLGEIDDTILNSGYKILLYSGLRDYYAQTNNEALYEEYNNKISGIMKNSEYEAGG